MIETLGRECREWARQAVNLETLIEENELLEHIIVYTDGSAKRGVESGWRYLDTYTANLRDEVLKEDPCFVAMTTSSTRVGTDYTTSCLKDKDIPRGAGRKSSLRGPSRRISNKLLTGTISPSTLTCTLHRDELI